MSNVYVIVQPGGWGHVSTDPKSHLVVEVDEWVKVLHKEKQSYDFVIEHTTYSAAHNHRNNLNGTGTLVSEPEPQTEEERVEVAVDIEGAGVRWLGERAA